MALSTRVLQAYLIAQWIFLSSTIILFNKYLLSSAKFHFPLTLVSLHMAFITVAAAAWRGFGWIEIPQDISWHDVTTRFLPVALLFALSLCLGNMAYLYISVAFVQMLKASTPVAVLLASFAFGLETPRAELGGCIFLIATGVAVSCYGQIQFDLIGFSVQMAAVGCEALRLCLVSIALTSKGFKLSPIAFLYFVAPLCWLAILPAWLWLEADAVCHHDFAPIRRVGLSILFANASVAFLLNLATMALIKHTSPLTLNVSGVFKDILLIVWSVAISGAIVTPVQYGGYTIAVVGVSGYMAFKRQQQQQVKVVATAEGGRSASASALVAAERAPLQGGCEDAELEDEKEPGRPAP